MFIEIESPNKKTKISSVEIRNLEISFFFSDFVYLTFEDLKEKRKFFEELFSKYPKNMLAKESYIEINHKNLSEEEVLSSGFNLISTKKLNVEKYQIKSSKNYLELIFYSKEKEKIRFVLYGPVLKKLKEEVN